MKIRIRYWDIYRRSESERQSEKDHVTRFGPYWVVEHVKRPDGARDYSTDGSPYELPLGYAGVWRGRTTPTGKAAPNHWAAQGRGPLPFGLGGLQVQMIRRRWAIDAVNELRLSNDPCAAQRLRDLRDRVLGEMSPERSHTPWWEQSHTPWWDEMSTNFWFARSDQLRWKLDAGKEPGDGDDEHSTMDTYVAHSNGMGLENITRTIAKRRAKYGKPLRKRKKAGRKPIGPIAQTSAERMRKYRRNKALKAPATHGRPTDGADRQPMPRLSAVPSAPFTNAQGGDTT